MKPHGKHFPPQFWASELFLSHYANDRNVNSLSQLLASFWFFLCLIKAGGLYCCRKVCGAATPARLRSSLMIMPHSTAEIEMERHQTGRREGKLLSKERERERESERVRERKKTTWRFAIQIPTLIFRVIPSLFWQLASRFSLHPFNLGVNKSGSKSNQSWLLRLGITAALYILTLALIPSQLNLAVRGERTGAWR